VLYQGQIISRRVDRYNWDWPMTTGQIISMTTEMEYVKDNNYAVTNKKKPKAIRSWPARPGQNS